MTNLSNKHDKTLNGTYLGYVDKDMTRQTKSNMAAGRHFEKITFFQNASTSCDFNDLGV